MGTKKGRPRRRQARAMLVGSWTPIAASAAARLAAQDAMALELRWQGGKAMLAALIDNDREVDFPNVPSGTNGVQLTWPSEVADAHFLQWDLLFSGERTSLSATASINDQGGFESPVGKASSKNGWTAQGRVIPEGGQ
jgi:hypothetical protein